MFTNGQSNGYRATPVKLAETRNWKLIQPNVNSFALGLIEMANGRQGINE